MALATRRLTDALLGRLPDDEIAEVTRKPRSPVFIWQTRRLTMRAIVAAFLAPPTQGGVPLRRVQTFLATLLLAGLLASCADADGDPR